MRVCGLWNNLALFEIIDDAGNTITSLRTGSEAAAFANGVDAALRDVGQPEESWEWNRNRGDDPNPAVEGDRMAWLDGFEWQSRRSAGEIDPQSNFHSRRADKVDDRGRAARRKLIFDGKWMRVLNGRNLPCTMCGEIRIFLVWQDVQTGEARCPQCFTPSTTDEGVVIEGRFPQHRRR